MYLGEIERGGKMSYVGGVFIGVGSVVNTTLIGFAARNAMNGEAFIKDASLLLLTTFCSAVFVYSATFVAMKLYYYYQYLRNA